MIHPDFVTNYLTVVKGDVSELFSKEIPFPVIISADKAKSLHVKVHDTIRYRFMMVTGQMQAVQLTVVAVVHPNNSFMSIV